MYIIHQFKQSYILDFFSHELFVYIDSVREF